MPDVLVRDVPRDVLDILKRIAVENHRSLQQELVLILEQAARKDCSKAVEAAAMIREQLSEYDRAYSDSAKLIREDRDR